VTELVAVFNSIARMFAVAHWHRYQQYDDSLHSIRTGSQDGLRYSQQGSSRIDAGRLRPDGA